MAVEPKIECFPPNHPFVHRVVHYKPSILGAHPYFWKHPHVTKHHGQNISRVQHRDPFLLEVSDGCCFIGIAGWCSPNSSRRLQKVARLMGLHVVNTLKSKSESMDLSTEEYCPTLLLNICGGCFYLIYNCSISTSSQHLMILPARNLSARFKKTGPRFIHDAAGIVTKVDGILNSPTDAVCCSDTCSIDLGDPCILQGCILGWSSNGGFKPPFKKIPWNTMWRTIPKHRRGHIIKLYLQTFPSMFLETIFTMPILSDKDPKYSCSCVYCPWMR